MVTLIDFKAGKIVYNEFHVDFNKPFLEQLDNLTEDLLQVRYTGGYLIDLGWYPEYESDGQFIVQLIKDGNWDQPLYTNQCKSSIELTEYLRHAVQIVSKLI